MYKRQQKDQVKQEAADPLIQNGQQLLPSVTRVFNKGRDLYVFLQAYEPTTTAPAPLIAFVSFYQGQTKVYETKPTEVTPPASTHMQTAPLNFTINLAQLPPGKYDCQVTVLDPTGQKGTFWQAPIMVCLLYTSLTRWMRTLRRMMCGSRWGASRRLWGLTSRSARSGTSMRWGRRSGRGVWR